MQEEKRVHHDHEHHHEGCGCGHEHHHDHEHHHEGCCCGHEHHHDHHAKSSKVNVPVGMKKTVYILENLGCANCAAKMERKINELPNVEEAVITYATKQLIIVGEHTENLLPEIQKICSGIEEEVRVIPKKEKVPKKKEKKLIFAENRKTFIQIGVGAILFSSGILIEDSSAGIVSAVCFALAYVILGVEIVVSAVKNLMKGHVFDENFLMSVATIAAFVIGDFAEAVGVMLFYRVGELFEEIAVSRSRSQIMDAVDLRPEVVGRMDGEEVTMIPAEEAKVGDILLVRSGDRIPLDGKVLEGTSQLDTSAVTGEPVPVRVYPGVEVYSGCVNTGGVLKIEVQKPLSESMVSRILDSVENAAASKPKIDRFITKFARVYTPVVVALALATAIIPSILTGDWNHWVYTAITFLVISCPCALVLSVPLAFFSGIGSGSKKGILFKGGVAIEALKNIKAVVMDKTGTITKGTFDVQRVVCLHRLTEKQILTMAADCEIASTHPVAVSIVAEAKKRGLKLVRPSEVEEIPGKGIRAVFPEGTVLCGNRSLMEMYHVNVDGYDNEEYGTEVLLAVDGRLEGYLVVADVVKPEAAGAVEQLRNLGLVTAILTGDERNSAKAIANQMKIDEVHAELLPQDKLTHLQDIRKKRGSVLFVGDGINDAPVLAGADVGAAMGSGADAAIEAADVVFMTSSVEAIPQSIEIAKNVGKIAIQNVVFALAIKFLVMILGLAGYANMWMAVFADTGVAMLCVLNSIRILYRK
ncbi:MAG: heavy metal translocating P-type ATPase [Christensenellales bacterium]